jgi:hypothetical protein
MIAGAFCEVADGLEQRDDVDVERPLGCGRRIPASFSSSASSSSRRRCRSWR